MSRRRKRKRWEEEEDRSASVTRGEKYGRKYIGSRWLVVVNACRVVDEDSRGLGSTIGSRGEGNLEETNGAGKGKGRSSAYFHLAASVAGAKIHFPTKCRHGRASSCWSWYSTCVMLARIFPYINFIPGRKCGWVVGWSGGGARLHVATPWWWCAASWARATCSRICCLILLRFFASFI